jgi:hypothetical protein
MPDLNRNHQLMRRAHTDWHRGDWKVLRLVSGVRGGRGGACQTETQRTLQLMRRAHTDWHRGDWKVLRLVSGGGGRGGLLLLAKQLSVLLVMPDLNRTLQLMRRAHTDWHRGDWKELRLVSGVRGGGGGLVTNTATRQPEPVVLRSKNWSRGPCETSCQLDGMRFRKARCVDTQRVSTH